MAVTVSRPFPASYMHGRKVSDAVAQLQHSLEIRLAHSEKPPLPYVLRASVKPAPLPCYVCCNPCCGGDRRASARRMSQHLKSTLLSMPDCLWRDGVVIMLDFADTDRDLLTQIIGKNWSLFESKDDISFHGVGMDKE